MAITLTSIGKIMKINKKILLGLMVGLIQSCDCHGIWSENIRRMNQCLEEHKENKEFCQKQMDKVGTCRYVSFEDSKSTKADK